MKSFGQVLEEHRGFASGFDFMRLFLALNVLAWHSPALILADWGPLMQTGAWILNYSILPMFFGLSGFLVAGSAQRQGLGKFAANRGLRIFPALVVEIILSAVLVGPLFTTLKIEDYFLRPEFFQYFLNILGWMHYMLPSVFTENPVHLVNGSLWTVPFEIICYLVMAVLIVTGAVKHGVVIFFVAVTSIVVSVLLQTVSELPPSSALLTHASLLYLHGGRGPVLLPCFLLGAAVYAWRDKIPFDQRLFCGAIAAVGLVGVIVRPDIYNSASWWEFTPLMFMISPLLIYIVVHAGLMNVPRLRNFSRGDYSYGIYLYGFPIQQGLIAQFPALKSSIFLHLAASAFGTTLFAALSWHLIEKPILGLRKNFAIVARAAGKSDLTVVNAPRPVSH